MTFLSEALLCWLKVSAVIITALLFLPGCTATAPTATTVTCEVTHVVIEPSKSLLVPTTKAAPPNKQEYLALDESKISDWRERERLLVNAYIEQTGAVDRCNADKTSITNFITKAKEKYEKKKDK